VLLLATAAIAGVPFEATPHALLFIALSALIPHLIGHTLLTWALRHTRPTVVGIATIGEPVGATLLAWVWLDELPAAQALAGCSVVVAAVALSLWRARPADTLEA
jgi:drug/metabolite transporter (DMT)-like permease